MQKEITFTMKTELIEEFSCHLYRPVSYTHLDVYKRQALMGILQ